MARRTMYEKHSQQDNSVDEALLDALSVFEDPLHIPLAGCILGGLTFCWEVSACAVLFVLHHLLSTDSVEPSQLLSLNMYATSAGLVTWRFSTGLRANLRLIKLAPLAVLCAVAIPVLHNLSTSFEAGSLVSLAAWLAIAHLLTHDYSGISFGVQQAAGQIEGGAPAAAMEHLGQRHTRATGGMLSTNAGMFSAALLAARLPSTYHAMLLLLVAAQLFVLLPYVRDHFRRASPLSFSGATLISAAAVTYMVYTFAPCQGDGISCARSFAAAQVVCGLLCPAMYACAQRFKSWPRGEWDCAEVASLSS